MANMADVTKRYLSILVPRTLVAKLDQFVEENKRGTRTDLCIETLQQRVKDVVLTPEREKEVREAIAAARAKRHRGEID